MDRSASTQYNIIEPKRKQGSKIKAAKKRFPTRGETASSGCSHREGKVTKDHNFCNVIVMNCRLIRENQRKLALSHLAGAE